MRAAWLRCGKTIRSSSATGLPSYSDQDDRALGSDRNESRRRWLTRDWRISRNRNPFLNADGYNVVVYPAGRGWSFRVSNRLTEKILASRRVLVSMDAAKLRAFDAMILMKERGD